LGSEVVSHKNKKSEIEITKRNAKNLDNISNTFLCK